MGDRTSIKKSLQSVLQSVSGIQSVYTNVPRSQPGNSFPSIVISFEKLHEKANTLASPGRRTKTISVTLYIQTIDANPDEMASQQNFDDLLDSIDDKLRANKDLNGTVLKCAVDYIDTDSLEPQLAGAGNALILRATKTFEILTEFTG